MSATTSVALGVLTGAAATARVGDKPLPLRSTVLDAAGLFSGNKVILTSSNTNIAQLTTGEQLGNAPAGVVGIAAGSATITATAADASTVTGTLVVTVS